MFVQCIRSGHCCGYRNDTFQGNAYGKDEVIPPDVLVEERDNMYFIPLNDGVCTYLKVHDNGFTSCSIYDKRPKMCALYNCLTEKKAIYLEAIIQELKGHS